MVVPSLMPVCANQLRTSLRISRHLPLYLWLPEMAELKFAVGMSVWWRWPTSFSSVFFYFTSCLSPKRNQAWCNNYSQESREEWLRETFCFDWLHIIGVHVSDIRKSLQWVTESYSVLQELLSTFIECCSWCCNNITDSCFGDSGF